MFLVNFSFWYTWHRLGLTCKIQSMTFNIPMAVLLLRNLSAVPISHGFIWKFLLNGHYFPEFVWWTILTACAWIDWYSHSNPILLLKSWFFDLHCKFFFAFYDICFQFYYVSKSFWIRCKMKKNMYIYSNNSQIKGSISREKFQIDRATLTSNGNTRLAT